jgi:hypothetical protein
MKTFLPILTACAIFIGGGQVFAYATGKGGVACTCSSDLTAKGAKTCSYATMAASEEEAKNPPCTVVATCSSGYEKNAAGDGCQKVGITAGQSCNCSTEYSNTTFVNKDKANCVYGAYSAGSKNLSCQPSSCQSGYLLSKRGQTILFGCYKPGETCACGTNVFNGKNGTSCTVNDKGNCSPTACASGYQLSAENATQVIRRCVSKPTTKCLKVPATTGLSASASSELLTNEMVSEGWLWENPGASERENCNGTWWDKDSGAAAKATSANCSALATLLPWTFKTQNDGFTIKNGNIVITKDKLQECITPGDDGKEVTKSQVESCVGLEAAQLYAGQSCRNFLSVMYLVAKFEDVDTTSGTFSTSCGTVNSTGTCNSTMFAAP